MRTVEIDDEVFAYLQSKAIAFVETPNITLRRLLGLSVPPSKFTSADPASRPVRTTQKVRRKQQRADLTKLIEAGLLQNGQTLYLRDYRGERIEGYEAKVFGKNLQWNGEEFSMSELAKKFLQDNGFHGDSVRGPAHWATADGVLIKDLWAQYLGKVQ